MVLGEEMLYCLNNGFHPGYKRGQQITEIFDELETDMLRSQ